MDVFGLFAGIGGLEYGLNAYQQNHVVGMCEILPEAQCVIRAHHGGAPIHDDITTLHTLNGADIVTAGFPCQDISIAGPKVGMNGNRSSLVTHIFRLIRETPAAQRPEFVVIENVANLISLHNGEVLKYITDQFNEIGYEWAYRLIDPRSLGIPQRRPRFVCIASRVIHPANLLFPQGEDVAAIIEDKLNGDAHNPYGFYWTEGKIGIGWANNSIPPLKCGSSLGLPSSPAVWNPMNDFFGMPSIHDAERLQGFDVDWTAPVQENGFKNSLRWKLLGNAVNTRVSSWIAGRIMNPNGLVFNDASIIGRQNKKWSKAGISRNGLSYAVAASAYPNGIDFMPILDYLQEPLTPLSLKATLGFRRRVLESTLITYPNGFVESLNNYLHNQYQYVD